MRYKVGDIITIKKNLMRGCYEGAYVSLDMLKFRGKSFEIEHIWSKGYKLRGNEFLWKDAMFEIANVQNETYEEIESKLKEALEIVNKLKQREQMLNSNKYLELNDTFWEDFKNMKVAVKCNFQNVYTFLKRCENKFPEITTNFRYDNPFDWFDNEVRYLYTENEVTFIYNETLTNLLHGDSDFYLNEGFKVINFDELNVNVELSDFTTKQLLLELQKRIN